MADPTKPQPQPSAKAPVLTPQDILTHLEKEDAKIRTSLARIRVALDKMVGSKALERIADVIEAIADSEDLPKIAELLEQLFGFVKIAVNKKEQHKNETP